MLVRPALAASLVLAAIPAVAPARVLRVGPGHRYPSPCAAVAAARPGDTIAVEARGGRPYRGDVCAWDTDRLTIRGVHGRAHVDAAGRSSEGKAIWVIAGDHTTVQDVELSGARVPDGNGAGIRLEGTGLRVLRSSFHDDEDGILTGADSHSDVVIESSSFFRDGAGDGYSHNIYIGRVRSFTLRASRSSTARVGHLVKSRALRNRILYNRLTGDGGTESYELDLPQGGRSEVIGNLIGQGRRTQNPALVAYGEEGSLHPRSRLTVVNNTLVDGLGRGPAILVGRDVRVPSVVRNNVVAGARQLITQADTRGRGNCVTAHPRFVAPRRGDYRPARRSPCRRRRPGPGRLGGVELAPAFSFLGVGRLRRRTDGGRIAGAFGTP